MNPRIQRPEDGVTFRERTHLAGTYEQPYAGRAYIPSQGGEYKGQQASDYEQGTTG